MLRKFQRTLGSNGGKKETRKSKSKHGSEELDEESHHEDEHSLPLLDDEVAFLSNTVRSYVKSHGEKNAPEFVFAHGVVLFMDISGFTKLSKTLDEKFSANSAAEDFGELCFEMLSRWTEIAYSFAGDVVKFAGDALLICWEVKSNYQNENQLLQLVHLAKHAGVEMLQCFNQTSLGTIGSENLDAHGGIGMGQIQHVHLTSPDGTLKWHLCDGPAVQDATALLDQSSLGEILIANQLDWKKSVHLNYERIDRNTVLPLLSPKRSLHGQHHPMRPKGHDNELPSMAVRAFIPASLRKKMRGGRLTGGEMRMVTVMFVGMKDLKIHKSTEAQVNRTFLSMTSAVHDHNGELRDMLMDDKGFVFIAVFGAYRSIENAEIWATRAAAQISKANPSCTIGISSGICFTGLCGTDERHDFVVMGHKVNTAARFMGAAKPGQVVVDSEVEQRCRNYFNFTNLVVETKKATYTEQYQGHILGNKISRQRRSTINPGQVHIFVGRTIETRLLSEFVEKVVTSNVMGLITIEGTAGIGKTAFCQWIRKGGLDYPSVFVESDSVDQETDFYGLRSLAEACTGLRESLNQEILKDKLDDVVRDGVSVKGICRLLPYLCSIDSTTNHDHDKEEENESIDTLIDLINRKKGNGKALMILMEDANWLDPASCDALVELFSRKTQLPGITFVLTFRSIAELEEQNANGWGDSLNQMRRAVGLQTRLNLGPLDNIETYRLTTFVFTQLFKRYSERFSKLLRNPTRVDPDILQLVYKKTQGLPAHVIENVNWFHAKKIVKKQKDGTVSYTNLQKKQQAEAFSPASVVEGIIAKYDKLGDVEKNILKVAACMGMTFKFHILHSILADSTRVSMSKDALHDHLSNLALLGFLDTTEQENEMWSFQTLAVLQSVLSLVPSTTKRTIAERMDQTIANEPLNKIDEILATGGF